MLVWWMEAVDCKVGGLAVVEDGVERSEGGSIEKFSEKGDRGIIEVRVDDNGEEADKQCC